MIAWEAFVPVTTVASTHHYQIQLDKPYLRLCIPKATAREPHHFPVNDIY
jgi:hypothetical protein